MARKSDLDASLLMRQFSAGLLTVDEVRAAYFSLTSPNSASTTPGGSAPWGQLSWSPAPYARGLAGFDGRGALPVPQGDGETPDVYGTVRGYRWWTLPAPPLHLSPALAEENWPAPTLLSGQQDTWLPGENIAVCKPYLCGEHDPALIPLEQGGCGFWAYWRLQRHNLGGGGLPVCGVIEGYGAVLLGEKGFRAAKARIVALHLPLVIQPESEPDPVGLGQHYARGNGWTRPARLQDPWGFLRSQGSSVSFYGMADPRKTAPPPPPKPTEEELRAAEEIRKADEDRAEAWMAVTGDRLERTYPGARIFETREAMEAEFPPDTTYEPEPGPCRCSEVRMYAYLGMNGHYYDCPQFR